MTESMSMMCYETKSHHHRHHCRHHHHHDTITVIVMVVVIIFSVIIIRNETIITHVVRSVKVLYRVQIYSQNPQRRNFMDVKLMHFK